MITHKSTYDECVDEIRKSVEDCMADFGGEEAEVSEDDVFCDIAESVLMDAAPDVAREVCRVQIGFVPGGLLRHWRATGQRRQ